MSLGAFEIEHLICSIFEQSEEEPKSAANISVDAICSSSRDLNVRTEANLLATIIKEVVFDPDAGSIFVTLENDVVEGIIAAKSNHASR